MTTTAPIHPVVRVLPAPRVSEDDDRRRYCFEVRLLVPGELPSRPEREVIVKQGERPYVKPHTADEHGRRFLASAAGRRLIDLELADMRRCGELQ
jgi:hypothetical protein